MLSHDGTVEDKFNTPRQSAHLSAIDLDTHKVKWQHALPYLSYVAAVGDKTLVTYTDKTVTSELIDAAGNRKPLGEYRAIRRGNAAYRLILMRRFESCRPNRPVRL